MFRTQGYGVGARYRDIDIASRVEGASPHRLIAILFEELGVTLDACVAAARANDRAKRAVSQGRADSILHALEASLDHARGGDIAAGLASIYAEARQLLASAGAENDPIRIIRARTMIGEIAGAWAGIA